MFHGDKGVVERILGVLFKVSYHGFCGWDGEMGVGCRKLNIINGGPIQLGAN